ncbi:MAG: DUF6484 domain-containing protein [Desulfatitalea sp.]
MQKTLEELVAIEPKPPSTAAAPRIGRIAGTDARGRILVSIAGAAPMPARHVAGMGQAELLANRNREVLLNFADGDPRQPIIVALMAEPIHELVCLDPAPVLPDKAMVDDRIVTLEAAEEIRLQCGPASILLRKDGKIVLKGVEIVSRAQQANKIKGASVQVN